MAPVAEWEAFTSSTSSMDEEYIDNAVDFFAHISVGSDSVGKSGGGSDGESSQALAVDGDEFSPEALRRSWLEAITDVGVVMCDKHEKLPDGYEKVDKTVGGESANLNFGSWQGRTTMICVRRRKYSRSTPSAVPRAMSDEAGLVARHVGGSAEAVATRAT